MASEGRKRDRGKKKRREKRKKKFGECLIVEPFQKPSNSQRLFCFSSSPFFSFLRGDVFFSFDVIPFLFSDHQLLSMVINQPGKTSLTDIRVTKSPYNQQRLLSYLFYFLH